MTDVDRIGGVPVVMKALLDAGLLHGDALTVTGRTMAENLAEHRPARRSTARSCAHGEPDPRDRRHHHPARVARARGRRGEVGRLRLGRLRGHRAGLRRRAGGDGRAGGRHDQRRRRRRDPLRGPQGRPGHARDARDHRRDQGRRPRQGRPAAHRRPVLRRHHRACASGTSPPRRSTAGRSRSSATATGSGSTSAPARSTCWSTTPSWSAAAAELVQPPPAVHPRRPGQVRAAGRARPPAAPSATDGAGEPRPDVGTRASTD